VFTKSALCKKKKYIVGKICRKTDFKPGWKSKGVMDGKSDESIAENDVCEREVYLPCQNTTNTYTS